jgi:hypothetical protein
VHNNRGSRFVPVRANRPGCPDDNDGLTSIPGLYAARDVSREAQFAIVAAGEGARAPLISIAPRAIVLKVKLALHGDDKPKFAPGPFRPSVVNADARRASDLAWRQVNLFKP